MRTNRTTLIAIMCAVAACAVTIAVLTRTNAPRDEAPLPPPQNNTVKTPVAAPLPPPLPVPEERLPPTNDLSARFALRPELAFTTPAPARVEPPGGIPAHRGLFNNDAISFYTAFFPWADTRYDKITNDLWRGMMLGVLPPTNLTDFVRCCIETVAVLTNGSDSVWDCIIKRATNEIFQEVLVNGVRAFYYPEYLGVASGIGCTNWRAGSACLTGLLGGYPPSLSNVILHNAAYAEVMQGKEPETAGNFTTLDADTYPKEAREWALYSPHQQLRDSQQRAWLRATNDMAPDVLEEILASWDVNPPEYWMRSPRSHINARVELRDAIDTRRTLIMLRRQAEAVETGRPSSVPQ